MKNLFFILTFSLNLYSNFNSFMGNDEKTSFIRETLLGPFTKEFEIDVPGEIISSPVIYNKKVIVTTRFGYIVCFDLSTGTWLWDYSTNGFIDATPYITSNTVVVPSMDGYLYAIDINSGENPTPIWQTDLKSSSISSPLVYKNKIYVGVGIPENAIKIIDFKTGNIIKTIKFEKPINSPISVCDNRIIFGGSDGKVYSMDEYGNDIKYYQTSGGNFNMKAISCYNSKLYFLPGYDERSLYKINLNDMSLISKTTDLTQNSGNSEWDWQKTSSIALSTYAIYFVVGDTISLYLYGIINDNNFSVLFSSYSIGSIDQYNFNFLPSPVVSNDYIFLTSNDKFYVILSTTGQILYTYNLSTTSYSNLAISDGRAVVSDSSGKVYVYKSSKYLSLDIDDIITSTCDIKISMLNPDATYYYIEYSNDDINYLFLSSGDISYSNEVIDYSLYRFDMSNLNEGNYYIRVRVGSLHAIKKIKLYNIPLPPYNLVVLDYPNDNGNRLILNWQSDQNYEYRIYRKKFDENSFSLIITTTSKTYIDSVVSNTTYTYKITSYDGIFESSPSNQASGYGINDNPLNDTIPPAKVNDLTVVEGPHAGSVLLSFNEVGDDGTIGRATKYVIGYSTYSFNWDKAYKIEKNVLANSGEIESSVIDFLFYGTTYYFALKVYDYAGNESELSNITTGYAKIDLIPPQPPSNFIVQDTDGDRGGRIALSWGKSPSENETDPQKIIYGYKIFRSTNQSFDYSIFYSTTSKGEYGYIDKNAPVGIKYYYQVCSYDSTNLSCSDIKWAISSDNFRFVSKNFGGTIYDSKSKAEVFIKPNSLNQDDYLIFYKVDGTELLNLTQSSGFKTQSQTNFKPTSIIYKLESSNPSTKLLDNALIKISYSENDFDFNENDFRMYYYDNGSWKLLRNSKINTESNYIEALYDKLGYYALFGYQPQGGVFDDNWIYTYPNPAKGDKLTFKFVINYTGNVEIEIYNVAGEIIDKLEKNNCIGGVINEIEWKIRNIASGVYVYIFKAKTQIGEKKVVKKLAIVK